MVEFQIRCQLAPALWAAQQYQRARRSPGRPRRLSGRRSLRPMGRQGIADEAGWGFAARGGVCGAEFAWGSELMPGGKHMANTWQGAFPCENLAGDGYTRTSRVDAFPPNNFGLFDMIGNVWEWTTDWYSTRHTGDAPKACCIPENPRGGNEVGSYDPCESRIRIPRKVVKGGSHLCAPNYCRRYRPAARHAQPVDTSMSHVGFRCISREGNGPLVPIPRIRTTGRKHSRA